MIFNIEMIKLNNVDLGMSMSILLYFVAHNFN